MASGTIEFDRSSVNSASSYIEGKIEWRSSADMNANASDVTAEIYIRKGNTVLTLTEPTTGTWTYSLTVNNVNVSGSVIKSVLEDWVLLATKTVSGISHNDDGTQSILLSGSVSAPSGTSYYGKTTSGSGAAELDEISRASTITSAAAVTLGNRCNVQWTPASELYRFKLEFTIGDWSYTTEAIHPNTTAAYSYTGYTIPLDVAMAITGGKTGTMWVALYTYSDEEGTVQIGSVSFRTFTVTVPNNSLTQPSVSMTLAPESALPDAFAGLYIQGVTKVKAVLSAEGKYGARIAAYSVRIGGNTYAGSDITSDYLESYREVDVYGYAMDYRGYTGSMLDTIVVIPYSKPQLLAVSEEDDVVAARCDAEGNLSDSGTYLKIKAKRRYSRVMSGNVQTNFCQIRFRYKLEGASAYSSWETVLAGDSLDSDEIITGALLGGVLAVDSTYLVQVQAIDDVGSNSSVTIRIPTDRVYMHRDKVKRALAIGKYIEEENCIDIAEDIKLKIRSEKWVSLSLAEGVSESDIGCGRGDSGAGCWYRVVNGNHVHVAFNVAFNYEGSGVTITGETIPEKYRPSRNVCGLAKADGKTIAGIGVTPAGDVAVDWVQSLVSGEEATEYAVSWIDGYIDYFINT